MARRRGIAQRDIELAGAARQQRRLGGGRSRVVKLRFDGVIALSRWPSRLTVNCAIISRKFDPCRCITPSSFNCSRRVWRRRLASSIRYIRCSGGLANDTDQGDADARHARTRCPRSSAAIRARAARGARTAPGETGQCAQQGRSTRLQYEDGEPDRERRRSCCRRGSTPITRRWRSAPRHRQRSGAAPRRDRSPRFHASNGPNGIATIKGRNKGAKVRLKNGAPTEILSPVRTSSASGTAFR